MKGWEDEIGYPEVIISIAVVLQIGCVLDDAY